MKIVFLPLIIVAVLSLIAMDEAPKGVSGMKPKFESPIVIGHRGASGYLPEHSTESAAMAHVMDADYIEQDCVLSKDGVPIVMHDFTLNDLTNVEALFPERKRSDGLWYVCDFTMDELRTLRLTERRTASRAWKNSGTRFPLEQGRFHIATLAEHLELIQGLNRSRGRMAGVYVEVKEPKKHFANGLDASKAILDVLAQYGYNNPDSPIFLQCFDKDEVKRIRHELKSPLPLIYLLREMPSQEEIQEAAGFCDGLGVLLTLVVPGKNADDSPTISPLVTAAHQHGLNVHVWTIRTDALPDFTNKTEELLNWLVVDAGVDGIFTDQPDVVVRWRRESLSKIDNPNPFRLLNNKPSADR
jgi:glycerophosphoryl diester phosphodiesterase